jgi:protocatechuate 3,4-dioxygenase beta subunit
MPDALPPEFVDVESKPARVLPLSVVDGHGRPVAGAWVGVRAERVDLAEATTDADGRAEVQLPADGHPACVLVEKPNVGLDYALFWRRNQPRSDPYRLDADVAGLVTFVLNGAKPVTVRVSDPAGRPLAGVHVYPWLLAKPRHGEDLNLSFFTKHVSRTTAADGTATFDAIPADQAGPITFWPRKKGYCLPVRCTYDPATGTGTVEATLVPMVRVTGAVFDADGRPAAGATVNVAGVGQTFDGFKGRVKADADGRFIVDVNPDQYYVFVASDPAKRLASRAAHRVVRDHGPADPVRLELGPARRVHGRVTSAVDGRPVADVQVVLQQDDQSYHDLPPAEQLPESTRGRRWIAPMIPVETTTDTAGGFELWAGPAKFQIYVRSRAGCSHHQKVTIADQLDVTVDLAVDAAVANGLQSMTGRVVLADQPEVAVPEASVSAQAADPGMRIDGGVSDRDGRFALHRGCGDVYLFATSPDKTRVGLVRVAADEATVTIPLGPPAAVTGRLLDARGQPAPGRTIHFGLNGLTVLSAFGDHVTTGPDGHFTLPGLVPRHDYSLLVVVQTDGDGRPRRLQRTAPVRADGPGLVEVGDRQLPE